MFRNNPAAGSSAQNYRSFSVILGQHEQMLNWLSEQPFVDPDRIGFYGLSYGGEDCRSGCLLFWTVTRCLFAQAISRVVWKRRPFLGTASYLLTKGDDM